jgi:hypothetical protein
MRTENEADRKDIQRVCARLAEGVDRGRVFTLDQVIQTVREVNAFEWRFWGNFSDKANRIWFARLLKQYCSTYTLGTGHRVELARAGTAHARCFTIKIL